MVGQHCSYHFFEKKSNYKVRAFRVHLIIIFLKVKKMGECCGEHGVITKKKKKKNKIFDPALHNNKKLTQTQEQKEKKNFFFFLPPFIFILIGFSAMVPLLISVLHLLHNGRPFQMCMCVCVCVCCLRSP